ncbi:MAG: fibro-slime domain-containing protein [Fibromonadaceae bacterium]|jgi:fibro-slime domain-containing protein|nr:fibro-slime domain-containing protein [Fibromonadaceae bacterium]
MNPVKTLCFTFFLVALLAASAAAQTVYFYPPDDAKWIAGRSYIHNGSVATPLEIDSTRCGWYRVNVPTGSPLRDYAQFWLGSKGKDRIGGKGRLETDFDDLNEFNSTAGNVFPLGDIFTRLGNNIFFIADEADPSDPNAGWYNSDQNQIDDSRCRFELAAFIYDTDPAVHPDFSCGLWDKAGNGQGNGPETLAACAEDGVANKKGQCLGVIRGLAKADLDPVSRKIQCGNCTKNQCWSDATRFEQAFRSTPGVNVERCYNMPFTLVKSGSSRGSYEFDSDKLMNAQGNLVGGFFPDILNTDAGLAQGDYSGCPKCSTKRSADRFNLIDSTRGGWEKWATKAQYDELVSAFYEYKSKDGDFADAKTPKKHALVPSIVDANEGAEGDIYDWTCRRKGTACSNGGPGAGNNRWTWYLHGSTPIKNDYGDDKTTFDSRAKANQHFCFESHAKFFYDPAQKFYFSGDDPIWVYINNKLVIDLGGAHLAAPDHVDLNTLGLEEGEEYPIDIFFCDQRTVNSNVRISTNMYIAQKAAFYEDKDNIKSELPLCAAIQKGADCASKMGMGGADGEKCGNRLIQDGYTVDFYLVRKGTTETIELNPTKNPDCKSDGSATAFTCYNGIKVNNAVYTCGGRGQCKGNPEAASKVNLTGNFTVYARLMENGVQVAGTKAIPIDAFKTETKMNIIWGNSLSEDEKTRAPLNDAYGNITTRNQTIIAGKRTPIYIATGNWADQTYATFLYDNDPEFVGGCSKSYAVTVSGGTGLKMFENATDPTPKSSGCLPDEGIATLWVEGDFGMEDNKEYVLNVTTESADAPSLHITIRQPMLRFTDQSYANAVSPNGYDKWATGTDRKPPFVGSPLDVYLIAWDPARNEVCSHCSFPLTQSASASAGCKPGIANPLVESDAGLRLEGGKVATYLHGKEDTGDAGCTATWVVYGLNKTATTAQWTGLRFRDAPVPIPTKSLIFDRNGDGIGDSVYIEFNKSFSASGKGDSLLPALLEVTWENGNTKYFHAPGPTPEQLKDRAYIASQYRDPGFFARNRQYWNQWIKKDSIIEIAEPLTRFSKDILTSGRGNVNSWIPFIDQEHCIGGTCGENALQYSSNPSALIDKISPIVTKAEYVYAANNKTNCEANNNPGCREILTVYLSEPIFAGPEATDMTLVKNPFSYCLGHSQNTTSSSCPTVKLDTAQRNSLTFDNLGWAWELPKEQDYATNVTYKITKGLNVMAQPGAAKGDSVVEAVYYSWKPDGFNRTRMPQSDDWVKIRPFGSGFVFQDAEGNGANPRERGVLITGTNPSKKRPIRIAKVDPNAPTMNGIFTPGDPGYFPPPWLNPDAERAAQGLFQPGNVSEFLPVPKHITHPDSIKAYFPGSVGTLFDIADKFHNDVNNFLDECEKREATGAVNICTDRAGARLTKDNIANVVTAKATAYYHTNLGDYVAHRDPVYADCTAEIFKNSEVAGGGNCYTNEYNFYLAWDLKANNNRFVGAGAYVGVSKFWMEITYYDGGKKKTKKLSQQEFIDMFGVRRTR